MKILFLTNLPSPYRIEFFNELGLYCNLTVLFERKSAADRDERWLNNDVNNFRAIFLKGKKIGADSALSFEVCKYLNKSYDLIVVGGYSTPTGMIAINYLNFRKIPFVLSSDGGLIKQDKKWIYLIKKYFISSAKAWLSTSKITDDYLVHYGALSDNIYRYPFTSINKRDIIDIYNKENEKENIRQTLNIKEEKVILSVGQIIPRKGYDVLLESMKSFPREYGVYIIGGKATEELLNFKKINNLYNLHFIEFKPKEELALYYKAADLFVHPTREDIWGLVINEAMANALPVITTDKCVAGLELVKNGVNGYIVPINNSIILGDQIKSILESRETRMSFSLNGLSKIQDFTIENMAKETFNIFLNIKEKWIY